MLEEPIGRPSLHPLCSVQELLDEANFFALEGLQQILLAQIAEIEASFGPVDRSTTGALSWEPLT